MTMETAGDAPIAPLSWAAKALVLAGGCAVTFAMSAVSPVLPRIEADLAHSPQQAMLVKQLVGVVGIALVMGAPLTGYLSDRIGLRPIYVANFLLITVAGTIGMFIDNLYILIGARFLTGLAAGGAITASVILINTRLPTSMRPTWMGAYVSVAMFIGIVLRPVTGLLGEHDWHWVFVIFLAGAPFALIAAVWFKDVPPAPGPAPATAGIAARSESMLRWFPLRFLPVGLAAGIITYMPSIYTPFLVRDMGITSPTMISLVLMGDAITAGVVAMLYGRARRYLSEAAAFSVTFAVATLGLALTALAPNYIVVMIAMAVFGIAVAWMFPNLLVAVGERVAHDQQGRAAGLVKASHYLAAPLGVLLAEPIDAAYGAKGVMMAGALLSAVLFAIFATAMIADRARRGRAAPSAE